jgi:hypothetical protein
LCYNVAEEIKGENNVHASRSGEKDKEQRQQEVQGKCRMANWEEAGTEEAEVQRRNQFMGEGGRMKEVQCHLTSPTTTGEINTVTWVDEALKPKVGMTVPIKGDTREWKVKAAYTILRDDSKVKGGK